MGSYLFKFFSLKLYSQYLLRLFYNILFYYLLSTTRSQTQLVRQSFKKDVLEFLVKILDKYTYKKFLKISFQKWFFAQIWFFSRILTTALKIIVWNMQLTEHIFHNTYHSKHKKSNFCKKTSLVSLSILVSHNSWCIHISWRNP